MGGQCGAFGIGVESSGRRWSACGGFGGVVWGLMAVLWADAVKIGKMLSASSPTSQELFGVVACC